MRLTRHLYLPLVAAGTPTERMWPGVSQLPDYKASFPSWKAAKLNHVVPALCDQGIDLVHVSTRRRLLSAAQ